MAQDRILGEQLNIVDLTSDIASDPLAIGNLATGIADDPTAAADLAAGLSHTDIQDIGSNSHLVIDAHIVDTTIHFSTINGLSNVNAPSPSEGDILTWQVGSGNWIPGIRVENPMISNLDTAGFFLSTADVTTAQNVNPITIQAGGNSYVGGLQNAGNINIYGGSGTNNNSGGTINIKAGQSNTLAGSDIIIQSGGSSYGVSGVAGAITMYGGVGTGGTKGGKIDIIGGNSTADAAGDVVITGGESGITTGKGGGKVSIKGGANLNLGGSYAGGDVDIEGGATTTAGGQSGNINIRPGGNTGNTAGAINFYAPLANSTEASIRLWSESSTPAYVALKTPAPIGSPVSNRIWILPQDDPSIVNGQFLTTDASGVLSFATPQGLENVVEDITPELGGDLDVLTRQIITSNVTTATNANSIQIQPGNNTYAGGGFAAGGVVIDGGDANNGNTAGGISIKGGNTTTGTGNAGDATIIGGNAEAGGVGGNGIFGGGDSTSSGNSGYSMLRGGSNTGTGIGGNAIIQGGDAAATFQAGDVTISAGGGTGALSGSITLHAPIQQIGQTALQFWNDTNTAHTTGNYIELKAPATTANRSWTLPDNDPSVSDGYVLTTDSSGVLTFEPKYKPLSITADTTTSYTLVLADAGQMITMNNAAANTVIIPTNASVAFDIGTEMVISQFGAGQTTFVVEGSPPTVTINSTTSQVSLVEQYSTATIIKISTDTWLLTGDLA